VQAKRLPSHLHQRLILNDKDAINEGGAVLVEFTPDTIRIEFTEPTDVYRQLLTSCEDSIVDVRNRVAWGAGAVIVLNRQSFATRLLAAVRSVDEKKLPESVAEMHEQVYGQSAKRDRAGQTFDEDNDVLLDFLSKRLADRSS